MRDMLREQTRGVHDALDRSVGRIADEPAYRRYLRGLYVFRAPIEEALRLARIPKGLGDWQVTPLAPRIGADLDDLSEPRPEAGSWRGIPEPSVAAGMLYVLEGAAIGANILRGRAARLGFGVSHGARHLARPEEVGRWSVFVARLDRAPDVDPACALQGARAAFDGATRAFAEVSMR
ncbi:biliverdin-producing heme oxygenase [Amaricoccus sp. W119]|uniref:biliverdin-producing heme oxygenase n=1 Tax=Amaricoccus sp. W119 TaxID=3391833 RepID=UPI0039A68E6D